MYTSIKKQSFHQGAFLTAYLKVQLHYVFLKQMRNIFSIHYKISAALFSLLILAKFHRFTINYVAKHVSRHIVFSALTWKDGFYVGLFAHTSQKRSEGQSETWDEELGR